MNASALKLLIAGEYICQYRFPNEFLALNDVEEQDEVNAWLRGLNMRLGRIGEEGAFFMAPDYIGPKEVTQVKNELTRFRDQYGRAVLLLDLIRQTDVSQIMLAPGEYIALYQLEEAVAHSTMLESQLRSYIGLISNASQRNSNHENLRRLMDQLVKDGIAILASKESSTYQITGKIEQLYAVLQFLSDNNVIPSEEVDDHAEIEVDSDLFADLEDDEATA